MLTEREHLIVQLDCNVAILKDLLADTGYDSPKLTQLLEDYEDLRAKLIALAKFPDFR
jgi:hypothetical protein